MWVFCNSLFSQTTAPKARNILPASHPRLNLSPIRKASFPPSGQVQGPQAARWLHSLRVNQTAGRPNPLLPPRDLATSPRRCASWPQPHCPADLSVPPVPGGRPWRASPQHAWPRPRARAQRLPPARRAVPGLPGQTKRPGPAMPPRAEGGHSPGTPAPLPGRRNRVGIGGWSCVPHPPRQAPTQNGAGPGAAERGARLSPGAPFSASGPELSGDEREAAWPASRRSSAPRTKSRTAAPRPLPGRARSGSGLADAEPAPAPTWAGGRAGGRRVPPAAAALAAGTAPAGDGHFIRAKVESV